MYEVYNNFLGNPETKIKDKIDVSEMHQDVGRLQQEEKEYKAGVNLITEN